MAIQSYGSVPPRIGKTLGGRKMGIISGSMSKHPGFKAVQSSIAKRQGISKERAGAILASATRKAGKAARKKNPRLNRVK